MPISVTSFKKLIIKKPVGHPRPLFRLFLILSHKEYVQFVRLNKVKKYMAPGFEPTTFYIKSLLP